MNLFNIDIHAIGLTNSHLIKHEGLGVGWKPCGIEVVHPPVHILHVSRPHMLAGIDTEASNTNLNQVIEEVRDLLAYIVSAQFEIKQAC